MLCVVLLGITAIPTAAAVPEDPHVRVRGMTISCQTWGWEWGTDDMVQAMVELRELGVNWITIHPYAGIREDGTVVMSQRAYARHDWLVRPIREAHRLGLKIMIKPHLAYWGSPFSWRGAITFAESEQWERFFSTYQEWVEQLATICVQADAFVVGTELDLTLDHADAWRRIIRAVRARTSCPLTYAANWSEYRRVEFWDELDVIGIQAYFPVAEGPGVPREQELRSAWSIILSELDDFARAHQRRIVFTELGYNTSATAAVEPWSYAEGGAQAEVVQERCLRAALQALNDQDTVAGAFLWKWFAGSSYRSNFLKSTPQMRQVIRECWTVPGGEDPP